MCSFVDKSRMKCFLSLKNRNYVFVLTQQIKFIDFSKKLLPFLEEGVGVILNLRGGSSKKISLDGVEPPLTPPPLMKFRFIH